jgi:hypothetical protein
MSRFVRLALSVLFTSSMLPAAEPDRLAAIRAGAGAAPVLEPGTAEAPKYQALRLNTAVVSHQGQRYAVVRLKIPAAPARPLVWMFADLGNIDEYEIMPAAGGAPIRGNLRVIYPPLSREDEEERPALKTLALPRPWDVFPLHILGISADLLRPGEDYLIWFRFADRRPTDVLLAATFLDPTVKLTPSILPGVLGLPELLGE